MMIQFFIFLFFLSLIDFSVKAKQSPSRATHEPSRGAIINQRRFENAKPPLHNGRRNSNYYTFRVEITKPVYLMKTLSNFD